MKFTKQLTCLALVAVLLFCAGCSSQDLTWAYRAGDIQVPIGVYIYNMSASIAEAQQKLNETPAEQEGEESEAGEESETSGEDQAVSEAEEDLTYKQLLKKTMADGTTVSAYIRSAAERQVKEYIAVEQKFRELGLTLTADELSLAAANAESYWSGDESYETNGIAEASLRLIIESNLKYQAIFEATYGPEGSSPVTEQQLKDEFTKSYAKVDILYFIQDTDEGADNSGLKAEAEGYLARALDGEDFYELIYAKEKADAGESADQVVKPEPGSRTMMLPEAYRMYYGDKLIDGVFGAEIGKPTLIEDEGDYYLVLRADALADFDGYRATMLQQLKGEEFEQAVTGWAEAVALEPNQPALDKYTPERLETKE